MILIWGVWQVGSRWGGQVGGTGLALMGKPCLVIFFHRQGVQPDESL